MPNHDSTRQYDTQHAQEAGGAVTSPAAAPTRSPRASGAASAWQTPAARRIDAFDRWLDGTRALPPLPPLDPPAELPPPASQSNWQAGHWALHPATRLTDFARADLRHASPASPTSPTSPTPSTPPMPHALSITTYTGAYPARVPQHLGGALTLAGARLPAGVSPRGATFPPATPGTMPLDAVARRVAATERRIFALCALCALLLLASAGGLLWWNAGGSAIASPGSSQQTGARASQAQAAAQTTSTTQTALPTLSPTATAGHTAAGSPSPAPTHAASRQPAAPPSVPSAGVAVVPVVPTTTALTLACSAPGTPLPLYNGGRTVQSWRLALPAGVVGNGWVGTLTGTVNPGNTLTLHLWQLAGASPVPTTVYVQSAGRQTAVRLTFAAC